MFSNNANSSLDEYNSDNISSSDAALSAIYISNHSTISATEDMFPSELFSPLPGSHLVYVSFFCFTMILLFLLIMFNTSTALYPPKGIYLNPNALIFHPSCQHSLSKKLSANASCFYPTIHRRNINETISEENGDFISITDITPTALDLNTPNSTFQSTGESRMDLMDNENFLHISGKPYAPTRNPAVHLGDDSWVLSYRFYTLAFFSIILSLFIYANLTPVLGMITSDQDSPQNLLQNLRLKRILIGHLNINSIRNKIGILEDIIRDRIDIFLVSETKIDGSFPPAQFQIKGFSNPYEVAGISDKR